MSDYNIEEARRDLEVLRDAGFRTHRALAVIERLHAENVKRADSVARLLLTAEGLFDLCGGENQVCPLQAELTRISSVGAGYALQLGEVEMENERLEELAQARLEACGDMASVSAENDALRSRVVALNAENERLVWNINSPDGAYAALTRNRDAHRKALWDLLMEPASYTEKAAREVLGLQAAREAVSE